MGRSLTYILIIGIAKVGSSQDPERFKEEIAALLSKPNPKTDHPIIFTGSSSVKYWGDLETQFPHVNVPIINYGFGGSHMSDLIFYQNDLILSKNPSKLFIYEGDNDLAYGKSVDTIIEDFNVLLTTINDTFPDLEVYVISPKPSIARWDLKDNYMELNDSLASFCEKFKNVKFINVWSPMLGGRSKPPSSLFVGDQLHMSPAGYKVWKNKIEPYLK